MFDIKKELQKVPHKSDVYIMYDKNDKIIYVGKAIDLRRRVGRHLDSLKKLTKVAAMVSHVEYFEYIIVNNECEALVLESNLIKKNSPKYSIVLKDDKQCPYIKITNEKLPRVLKTRCILKDKAKYFRPFPNAYAVNDTIDLTHETYKIRTCNLNFDKGQKLKRPCLNYYINRCDGTCVYDANEEDYNEELLEVENFLNGREDESTKKLTDKVMDAPKNLNLELAVKLRDSIANIRVILEKQNITNTEGLDLDMISTAREAETVYIQVFFMRDGKATERQHSIIDNKYEESNEHIVGELFRQFYIDSTYVLKQILTDTKIEDREFVEEMLTEKKGSKVETKIPKRGNKTDLLEMAKVNTKGGLDKYISRHLKRERNRENAILDLQDITGVKPIDRIECYDVSNTSGADFVGSMIAFKNGAKSSKDYRKSEIKIVEGADDYASRREISTRRFRRLSDSDEKDSSFDEMSSIILMNDGKGQTNTVKEVLNEFNLGIPILGPVKDDKHRTRGIIYESEEIRLRVNTPLYRSLFAAQEEIHRFTINYHRKFHEKNFKKSELGNIKLIGEKRKKALMKHFKTLDRIKEASVEELCEVDRMNEKTAGNIVNYFKQ